MSEEPLPNELPKGESPIPEKPDLIVPLETNQIVDKDTEIARLQTENADLKRRIQELDELVKITTQQKDELATKVATLEEQKGIDKLTGLREKASYAAEAEKAVGEFYEGKRPELVIIGSDADNFSYHNNLLDHAWGDALLETYGRMVSENFRREDASFRDGGEEFKHIPAGNIGHEEAVELAQRLSHTASDELIDRAIQNLQSGQRRVEIKKDGRIVTEREGSLVLRKLAERIIELRTVADPDRALGYFLAHNKGTRDKKVGILDRVANIGFTRMVKKQSEQGAKFLVDERVPGSECPPREVFVKNLGLASDSVRLITPEQEDALARGGVPAELSKVKGSQEMFLDLDALRRYINSFDYALSELEEDDDTSTVRMRKEMEGKIGEVIKHIFGSTTISVGVAVLTEAHRESTKNNPVSVPDINAAIESGIRTSKENGGGKVILIPGAGVKK